MSTEFSFHQNCFFHFLQIAELKKKIAKLEREIDDRDDGVDAASDESSTGQNDSDTITID